MDGLQEEMTRLRRELHKHAEVGLDLPRTQDSVLDALRDLPLEITTGVSSTAVTGVLRGGRPGPAVLLRADMDALPIGELTGAPFASTGGTMHACGHDLHTAMLVGAAHLLNERRDSLAGDVVFMFQPGEEGCDGAAHMLAEGVLDAASGRVVAAYALHVTSALLPAHYVATRPGPVMAAVDTLRVCVRGRGGHGSAPYRAADPVQAACAMVTALQTYISREVDVFDPVVLSVGQFHAGTAPNIIPDVAEFEATVRSFSAERHLRLLEDLPRVCRAVAEAHNVEVSAVVHELYPVTVNDAAAAPAALRTAAGVVGEDRVFELPQPVTGSEDFSRILNAVPGAMLFLGATPPGRDPATAPHNHSPEADFDESVMIDGACLYAELAAAALA